MDIKIDGTAEAIIKDLGVLNKKIQKTATVRAINKSIDKTYTETVRELSKATKLPQYIFRGRRQSRATAKVQRNAVSGLAKKYKANNRKLRGRVWLGLAANIPLQKLIKNKKQAAKYEKFLKKSLHGKAVSQIFEATMKTGKRGYYVRKGSGRLPISEAKVNISAVGRQIVERAGARYGQREFGREFDRQMKVLINKKGAVAYRRV